MEALPNPHDPLLAIDHLAAFDRMTIAERVEELGLAEEERAVLVAELESLANAPLGMPARSRCCDGTRCPDIRWR